MQTIFLRTHTYDLSFLDVWFFRVYSEMLHIYTWSRHWHTWIQTWDVEYHFLGTDSVLILSSLFWVSTHRPFISFAFCFFIWIKFSRKELITYADDLLSFIMFRIGVFVPGGTKVGLCCRLINFLPDFCFAIQLLHRLTLVLEKTTGTISVHSFECIANPFFILFAKSPPRRNLAPASGSPKLWLAAGKVLIPPSFSRDIDSSCSPVSCIARPTNASISGECPRLIPSHWWWWMILLFLFILKLKCHTMSNVSTAIAD